MALFVPASAYDSESSACRQSSTITTALSTSKVLDHPYAEKLAFLVVRAVIEVSSNSGQSPHVPTSEQFPKIAVKELDLLGKLVTGQVLLQDIKVSWRIGVIKEGEIIASHSVGVGIADKSCNQTLALERTNFQVALVFHCSEES